jgi:hypothetical protein
MRLSTHLPREMATTIAQLSELLRYIGGVALRHEAFSPLEVMILSVQLSADLLLQLGQPTP